MLTGPFMHCDAATSTLPAVFGVTTTWHGAFHATSRRLRHEANPAIRAGCPTATKRIRTVQ